MDFTEFISHPAVIWFVIGLILMLMEFALPGLIVIFFGVGAWITALLTLIFGFGLNVQLIIFISTSLLSLLLLRKYVQKIFLGKKTEDIDDTIEEFIGKTATVEVTITPEKRGKVLFKGTQWEAESDSAIEAGTLVTIVDKESIVFKVEPKSKI